MTLLDEADTYPLSHGTGLPRPPIPTPTNGSHHLERCKVEILNAWPARAARHDFAERRQFKFGDRGAQARFDESVDGKSTARCSCSGTMGTKLEITASGMTPRRRSRLRSVNVSSRTSERFDGPLSRSSRTEITRAGPRWRSGQEALEEHRVDGIEDGLDAPPRASSTIVGLDPSTTHIDPE